MNAITSTQFLLTAFAIAVISDLWGGLFAVVPNIQFFVAVKDTGASENA